jgi:hypothetical protein
MRGLDDCLWLTTQLSGSGWLPPLAPLLGYMGLGQGPELIPYFAALASFVGAALIAVLQWPLSLLFRRFSKAKRRTPDQPPGDLASPSQAEPGATADRA